MWTDRHVDGQTYGQTDVAHINLINKIFFIKKHESIPVYTHSQIWSVKNMPI